MLYNYFTRESNFKYWIKIGKKIIGSHESLIFGLKLTLTRVCFCLLFQIRFVKQQRMNFRFILSKHFSKLLKDRRKPAAAGGGSLPRVLTPLGGAEARQIDLVQIALHSIRPLDKESCFHGQSSVLSSFLPFVSIVHSLLRGCPFRFVRETIFSRSIVSSNSLLLGSLDLSIERM